MNRKERRRQQKLDARHGPFSAEQKAPDPREFAAALQRASETLSVGRLTEAVTLIDDILLKAPNHPDGLNLKAGVLMQSGDTQRAIKVLTKVASLVPDFAQAHFNLGTALNADNKQKRALRSLRRALELDPAYTDAHYNLANAYRQLGNLADAIEHYEKALEQHPNHSGAATNLASAHLELGNALPAREASEQALISDPGNRDAISFCAIASTELGDAANARYLLNPEQLIRPYPIGACEGFDTIAAFNAALVEHVLTHPTLTKNAHNKATRNGAQTENLALGEQGPIAALQGLIGDALDQYLASVAKLDHPYPRLIPKLGKLDIWGTVLDAQGHQASHMHRAAWVSGVYYAKLPDIMKSTTHNKDGWIEFCRPPDTFACQKSHEVHVIEPKEGLMVLFPSYVYHRTIPFVSDQQRISIAFDLLE